MVFALLKKWLFGTWFQSFAKGHVALISKSESLLYLAANQLKEKGLGISFAMHIGNEPLHGLGFKEGLQYAKKRWQNKSGINDF